jgi:hypothetical protein
MLEVEFFFASTSETETNENKEQHKIKNQTKGCGSLPLQIR